jgi:protein-S-isoprenylcysteine O-methyltransferase Ste14
MNKLIIRTSLSDAVYFSFASFLIVWLASILYSTLEKTTGRLNMGAVVMIILSLILIMFILAITNIVLSEHERVRIHQWERVVGVLLFLLASALILGILSFLFWFEF